MKEFWSGPWSTSALVQQIIGFYGCESMTGFYGCESMTAHRDF